MPLLLASCLLAATPLVQGAVLERALVELNRHASEPVPQLTPEQRAQLCRGQVVSLYRAPVSPVPGGGVGLLVMRQSRDTLWRVVREDQAESASDLTTHLLAVDGGDEISYGHLRLPWPFAARRWQVRSRDNQALAAATRGRARERSWDLEPGEGLARAAVLRGQVAGVSRDDFERAVATPYNRGAWLAVDLDGQHTLLGFSVTTQVGGVIPDELVARYSVLRVATQLREVEHKARVKQRQDGGQDAAKR